MRYLQLLLLSLIISVHTSVAIDEENDIVIAEEEGQPVEIPQRIDTLDMVQILEDIIGTEGALRLLGQPGSLELVKQLLPRLVSHSHEIHGPGNVHTQLKNRRSIYNATFALKIFVLWFFGFTAQYALISMTSPENCTCWRFS